MRYLTSIVALLLVALTADAGCGLFSRVRGRAANLFPRLAERRASISYHAPAVTAPAPSSTPRLTAVPAPTPVAAPVASFGGDCASGQCGVRGFRLFRR